MTSERVDYKAKIAPTTNKIGQGQADDSQKKSSQVKFFWTCFRKIPSVLISLLTFFNVTIYIDFTKR